MMQRRFVHACACRLVTGGGVRGWKEGGEGREGERRGSRVGGRRKRGGKEKGRKRGK